MNEPKINTAKKEAFEHCYSRLNLVVGAANSIAGKWLFDAVEMMEQDKKLFRFTIKHEAHFCKKMFNDYEKAHLTDHGGMKQFYIDYLDVMDDRVQPHAEKMYWAIKNRLDKENVENSALFAKMQMATTLIDYSVYLYDYLIADVKATRGYDFDRIMRPARLKGLERCWTALCNRVCKLPKGVTIDLNEDTVCMLGFRCIENILTNEDELNRAGGEALRLNPDIAERFGVDLAELSDSENN